MVLEVCEVCNYAKIHLFTNHLWTICMEFGKSATNFDIPARVVLDSFFWSDSTLTHMTIQVTQLRLNSNPEFANLSQL